MTVSRRRFAATGVALALALTLGACTPGGGSGETAETTIAGTTPLTVQNQATWSAEVLEDAPIRLTSNGVLTFSASASVAGETYVPVLLSSKDGSVRWSGEPVESATMPGLEWVDHGDAKWAVARVRVENTVSLYAWNGLASRAETPMSSSTSFEGKKTPPKVHFSGSGVLVTGADKTAAEPLIFWPKDASLTRYKGGPKRGGDVGTPIGVYGSGFLVSFPSGGFSLATANGGWSSASSPPEGGNPQSGVVLAQGDGYVISEWSRPSDQEDETNILAVHSASSGRLFAQYEMTPEEVELLEAQKSDGAALVTEGARWLVWGQFGFDLHDGGGTVYDLGGGRPTAVIDSMLYVRDASSTIPLPDESREEVPESPAPPDGGGAEPPDGGGETSAPEETPVPTGSPAPSDGGGGEVANEVPEGFTGVTGIDMQTSQPLSGVPSMFPIGRTETGQIILLDESKQSIHSVGLR